MTAHDSKRKMEAGDDIWTSPRMAGTMKMLQDWLCLAAAPSFAMMALLTYVLGDGAPYMLCSAARGASPLSGMGLMYFLMSVFHSAPWLKLIASRRCRTRQC
jgi:hypothetical protein